MEKRLVSGIWATFIGVALEIVFGVFQVPIPLGPVLADGVILVGEALWILGSFLIFISQPGIEVLSAPYRKVKSLTFKK